MSGLAREGRAAAREPLDLSLQIAPDAVSALAEQLAGGRLRLAEALAAPTASALHAELDASPLWRRTMRQGKAEREIPPEQLAALEPRYLRAIEQFAHGGPDDGFRFLHDAIRVSTESAARLARGLLIDRLAEALNAPESLDLFRTLARDPDIVRLYLDATRYLPGHFLTRHNDGRKSGQRVIAFVLNLSPRWLADWGGLLQFHDDAGDIARALTPSFNTLHLFQVPQWHSVSIVAPFAPVPRYALAGWLYRD